MNSVTVESVYHATISALVVLSVYIIIERFRKEKPKPPPSPPLDKDIQNILQTLQHGFTIGDNELFPLSRHQKAQLFDEHKLNQYAKTNMLHESHERVEKMTGRSVSAFSQEFGAKMGGNCMLTPALAPAAKAELGVGETQTQFSSFSQERHQIFKKQLIIPQPNEKEGTICAARMLLSQEAREELDAVCDKLAAETFLRRYGHLYVQKAYIGGSYIRTSKRSRSFWFKERSAETTMKPSSNTEVGAVKAGKSMSKESTSSYLTEKKLGGRTSESDLAKWLQTINNDNRSLIQCEFAPVYQLACEAKARYWLERATEKSFTPIQSGGKYCIVNMSSMDISCLPEEEDSLCSEPEVEKSVRLVVGENLPSQRPSFQSYNKVFVWSTEPGQQHMKAAFANNDRTKFLGHFWGVKVAYSGMSPWVDQWMSSIRPGRWTSRARPTVWHLERVRDNVYLVRTCKDGPVLGVRRTKLGEWKYILAHKTEKDPEKYEDVFQWEFSRFTGRDNSSKSHDDRTAATSADDSIPSVVTI